MNTSNQVELEKIVKRSLLDRAAKRLDWPGCAETDVIEALRNELERRECDLMLAGEIGSALLESNRSLQDTKAELQDECARLQKEIERERVGGQKRLTEYSFEVQRECQQLELDVCQLKATLDAERKSSQTKQERLKSSVSLLRDENEQLQEKLTNAINMQRRERAALKKQALDLENAMEIKVDDLKEKNEELVGEKVELEEALESCVRARDSLAREVEGLRRQIEESKAETELCKVQMCDQSTELEEIQHIKEGLKEKLEEQILQNSFTQLNSYDGSLMAEIEQSSASTAVQEERDLLIEKNSALESLIEKYKDDANQMESQLLVVIKQKLDLTQQLEDWQNDMASVVSEQVCKRLDQQESAPRKRRPSPLGRKAGNSK
eukprot:m.7538 g.7538  ORF g.7538 m.7538 type:complete len:380 (+) comp18947_c0_seq1:1264-2403(+)